MSDFTPNITVGPEEFLHALKHGVELWNDGSTPTFRLDRRGGRSGFTRYVNSRIEGKLAEEAFSIFLEEYYGLESAVDYDIYGDIEETDYGDLKHIIGDDGEEHPPSVEFDVKKTKPWNKWLALRTDVYDRQPDDAPFVLTKLAIDDDLILDAWEDDDSWDEMAGDAMFETRVASFADVQFPLDVEMVGVAYKDEFTEEFEEGDRLYDPNTEDKVGGPLRRDNVAIPCDELVATKERWDQVVADITQDIPVEYEELSE